MERQEGITLRSTPYDDKRVILTVFTESSSIISLMINVSHKKRTAALSLFCLSEFVYEKKRGEIFSCLEVSVLNEHLFLRKKLEYLQSAGIMARAILSSQLPHKRSADIYLLFKRYLAKMAEFQDPFIVSSSFLLKILLYEGLFNPEHTQNEAHTSNFTEKDKEKLFSLALVKSFSELKNIELTPDLSKKVNIFFNNAIEL